MDPRWLHDLHLAVFTRAGRRPSPWCLGRLPQEPVLPVNVVVQRPSVRAAGEAASAHRSSYLRVPVTKPRLNFAAANLDRILVGDCVALWIPGAASCGTVKPDVERSTQLWVRVALPYLRCVGGALNRLLDGA